MSRRVDVSARAGVPVCRTPAGSSANTLESLAGMYGEAHAVPTAVSAMTVARSGQRRIHRSCPSRIDRLGMRGVTSHRVDGDGSAGLAGIIQRERAVVDDDG